VVNALAISGTLFVGTDSGLYALALWATPSSSTVTPAGWLDCVSACIRQVAISTPGCSTNTESAECVGRIICHVELTLADLPPLVRR
jgi:hypothetical protein